MILVVPSVRRIYPCLAAWWGHSTSKTRIRNPGPPRSLAKPTTTRLVRQRWRRHPDEAQATYEGSTRSRQPPRRPRSAAPPRGSPGRSLGLRCRSARCRLRPADTECRVQLHRLASELEAYDPDRHARVDHLLELAAVGGLPVLSGKWSGVRTGALVALWSLSSAPRNPPALVTPFGTARPVWGRTVDNHSTPSAAMNGSRHGV